MYHINNAVLANVLHVQIQHNNIYLLLLLVFNFLDLKNILIDKLYTFWLFSF